ncbi:MAG: class I SAM-dependent methyltransferase [Syntrophobacterales bacterium]|jgi:SAM-dependent methyltransferase
MAQNSENEILSSASPLCYLCGAQGRFLYQGLEDRLFGAPGQWNVKQCDNLDCGLLWLDPMPLESHVAKGYRTYYTHTQSLPPWPVLVRIYLAVRDSHLPHKIGNRLGVFPSIYKYIALLPIPRKRWRSALDRKAIYLPGPTQDARFLEIGCGSGDLLARMQKSGWQTEGVDFDPVAVEIARSKGLAVRLGDLVSQDYPNHQFDCIYMGHVIEHAHAPLELLKECYRILKPGGVLLILTPNAKGFGHKRFEGSWRGLEPPRHLFVFSPRNLRQAAAQADFQIMHTSTITTGAFYILSMSKILAGSGGSKSVANLQLDLGQIVSGLIYQFAEMALHIILPEAGEEILLIARKA